MKIVITGQTDLRLLSEYFDNDSEIPRGHGGIPPAHEIRMLVERGHEVVLVTLDSTLTEEVVLRGDRLTVHVGPCRPDHPIRNLYRQEREYLTATIRSIDPDVVHAHWTYEYALAALDSGYPVTVTIHDAPLRVLRWNLPQYGSGSLRNRFAQFIHWAIRGSMAWRVARKSRFNIAVSPHTRDHYQRVLRSRGEVEVIPNLMNPDVWSGGGPSEPSVPSDSSRGFVCTAVLGSWGELKNAKTLLRAFTLVRALGIDASLQLIGKDFGPHGPAALWARRHNLAGSVNFIGPISNLEVAELLKSTDVLTHPSREEACGMAIAEAQLASTAVVGGSSSGGVSWTLNYGVAGALVNVESAEQIAGAIVALANDSVYRDRLARAGHDLAMRRYEPSAIITAVEAILRRCMDATSPPSSSGSVS